VITLKEFKLKQKSWVLDFALLGFVWGCSFIFIKLGLQFLTPAGVAFARVSLGAITLLLIAKQRKIELPKGRETWFYLWIVSLLLNVIPGFLFAYAETHITSVLAGIINACTPFATLIFTLLLVREESPKFYQIAGLVVGAFGVATVLGIWNGFGESSGIGIAAAFVAITCYGLSFPVIRKFLMPRKLKPESMAAGQLLMATITLTPFFIYHGVNKYHFIPRAFFAMLALGIFGSGVAYIWNFRIVATAGGVIASSVTFVTPVVAVLVGWLFLGENVSIREPIGALIVIFGAALAQGRFKKHKQLA
jgi:drug/metabolite transporter (DMT)-like permease